ncbi:hypothetical protein [Phyllobacterium endophyticum]|uniref:Uncharacterized protein n=1 Tax=Phyllobacterium endophyticum TaxID=1149773 RepID=A0A2P7AYL4_9HYPH|nr:hypothetical protein [Phyllobacterium endophyticum]MBB3236139.1 hypothetical protein [Phyllobacterium endophyticum]PSH59310.1 hypothetical protein CU100_00435 [Phyllobacterium endophyticum]TYR41434.1 hypothetical protein FY050_09085 [Phyllobacterium endophyticum]
MKNRPKHSGIAILETRWYNYMNVSIAPLYTMACEMFHENHPHTYHYETVGSPEAFGECLERVSADERIDYIYVASHGDRKPYRIEFHNGKSITQKLLPSFMAKYLKPNKIRGIHFGVCHIGTEKFLTDTLEICEGLTWVSGYSTEVDWIYSAALDQQFFYTLLNNKLANPPNQIEKATKKIMQLMSGACEELGLSVCKRDADGSVRNLVENAK